MKHTNRMTMSGIFAAGLLAATPAISAGTYAAMSELPPTQIQGNVTYLSGGIGQTEAAAIRRQEASFPLSLEFVKHANPGAEYLAGVNVTIKDYGGKTMLSTVADGPFLLVRLPDGQYTVTAVDNGGTKVRDIVIAEHKQEHVVFEW